VTTLAEHNLAGPWRYRITQDVDVVENQCWLWRGQLNGSGYGRTTYGRSHEQLAHRLAYRLWVGEIPAGYTIDHLCRNRACVNPVHLEPVTNKENILRGEGVAARRARQTHCKRGHEFTPENTRTTAKGSRVCRTCQREARRQWYLEHGR
jgi:hypothetical protein